MGQRSARRLPAPRHHHLTTVEPVDPDTTLDPHAPTRQCAHVDPVEIITVGTEALATTQNQTPTPSTNPNKHRQTTSRHLMNDRG